MLFSGIKSAVVPLAGTSAIRGDIGRRKIELLTANATTDTSKATMSAYLGQRGALTGLTLTPDACFHLLLRLSFSGSCGLPRLSL